MFLSQPSDIIRSAKLYRNIHTNAHIFEGLPQLLLDLIHVGSDQEAEKTLQLFQSVLVQRAVTFLERSSSEYCVDMT